MANLDHLRRGFSQKSDESDNILKIPCLEVIHKGKRKIHFIEKKLTIGVQKSCHIILKDPKMAPLHCFISKQGKVVLLTILDDQVKTYLGEDELSPHKTIILKDQDKLRIGVNELRLRFLERKEVKEINITVPNQSIIDENYSKGVFYDRNTHITTEDQDNELPPPLPKEILANKHLKINEDNTPPIPVEIQKSKEFQMNILEHNLLIWVALAIDLSISYLMFYQIKLLDVYQEYIKSIKFLYFSIFKYQLLDNSYLISGMTVIFFFWGIRSIYSFLFGVSLGQLMVGTRSNDSFIWKRVGGIIRCFVGMITFPFIFFDLPVVFQKRSFKEVISLTTLKSYRPKTNLILTIILFPISLMIIFSWPLFFLHKNIDILYLNYNEISHNTLISNHSENNRVKSRHFKFEYTQNLSHHLSFMPSFDLIKKGKEQKIRPYLEIYDRKRGIRGEFRVKKRSTLYQLLVNTSQKIPFFKNDYPLLAIYLKDNAHLKRKNKMTPATIGQLNSFIRLSINFNFKDHIKRIFKLRPFNYGFYDFRNKLFSAFGEFQEDDDLNLQIVEWGDQSFLVTFYNKNYFFKSTHNRQRFIIPLKSMNGLVYEILWEDSPKYIKTEIDFFKYFSNELYWRFDELSFKNLFYLEDKEKNPLDYLSLFHITDYYALSKNLKNERSVMDHFLYYFYLTKSQKALDENNNKEINVIAQNMQRMINVAELITDGSGKQISAINNLKEIKWALVNLDTEFFRRRVEQFNNINI